MEYKVGDKVRLKNVGIVTILSICYDIGIFYYNKGPGVITFDTILNIESKILDIDGSNLEKLKEQYNKMGETIKQLEKEKEKTIYVPDCIKINTLSNKNVGLGIINEDGYELCYVGEYQSYHIGKTPKNDCKYNKTKLIKTTWGKLNPGDICYGNNNLMRIDELCEYGIKLKDGSRQSWLDKDCVNDDDLYLTDTIVYKVVLA